MNTNSKLTTILSNGQARALLVEAVSDLSLTHTIAINETTTADFHFIEVVSSEKNNDSPNTVRREFKRSFSPENTLAFKIEATGANWQALARKIIKRGYKYLISDDL